MKKQLLNRLQTNKKALCLRPRAARRLPRPPRPASLLVLGVRHLPLPLWIPAPPRAIPIPQTRHSLTTASLSPEPVRLGGFLASAQAANAGQPTIQPGQHPHSSQGSVVVCLVWGTGGRGVVARAHGVVGRVAALARRRRNTKRRQRGRRGMRRKRRKRGRTRCQRGPRLPTDLGAGGRSVSCVWGGVWAGGGRGGGRVGTREGEGLVTV